MKLLLRLYPGWWRRRYGAEALDILESRPATPSLLWNVVIGAVDAWLNQGMPPNSAGGTNERESEGGYLMTGNRKRNKRVASVLALVGLMVLVRRLRRDLPHDPRASRRSLWPHQSVGRVPVRRVRDRNSGSGPLGPPDRAPSPWLATLAF
jgi:hypothetical protein